jgi:HlyD family secretion protein
MNRNYRIINIITLAGLGLGAAFACRGKGEADISAEVSGVIEAVKTEIRAQAQGEIDSVAVREGQKVEKGELLCSINSDKLRLQLDQVKAGRAAAEARLKLARMGTKKELVAMAENQLDLAKKQLELAEKDQQRLAKLLAEGAVSQAQKDRADLALKAALEQRDNAEENFKMARRGREKEEIDIVLAEIQGLEAQERLLERSLRDTEVRAPTAGTIEVRNVEVGELAIPGAVLFSLLDLGRTYVKAYVPEQLIGRVKLGGTVEVRNDSYPGKTYAGKVDFISDEAEFAPRNIQTKEERIKLVYMIKAFLDNSAGELKPGMPVDVKVSF